MPAQLFSITKPDGSTISGDLLEGKVIQIFQKQDTLANLGLLYEAPATVGQTVRIPAPLRILSQNYAFSANDSGITPDEVQTAELKVPIEKFSFGSFTTETLDASLWSSTGAIRGEAMKSLGATVANTMLMEYLDVLSTTITANKDTQAFVLPAEAKTDTITTATAVSVVNKVKEIVRNFRIGITPYRVGLPSEQIKLLASYEFIDIYANCLAVMGHKPEFVQSQYVEGTQTLKVSGVELVPFWPLRTNIPAGSMGLHKTKAADMSNFYLVALPKFALPIIKGNVEMWENRAPKTNNPISGAKSAFGLKQYPEFKTDIYGIVETAIA